MNRYDLVIVTGPTASGKTALAAALASALNGEVISADSRQVYRGMDIGTGKDYDDYLVGNSRVPVHLIDIVDPGYKYNVFEYQRDFLKVYTDMKERGKFPVVCGGSGMYIDSIVSGYRLIEVPPDQVLRDEMEKLSMEEIVGKLKGYKQLHNVTDIDTKKRAIRAIEIEEYYRKNQVGSTAFPKINSLVAGLKSERESRRKRITERLKKRLKSGMIDEVKGLIDKGVTSEMLIYYGLEYKYITLYLTGKLSYEGMFTSLETAIHQYAKRQMTWFRGMERKGKKINWIDSSIPLEAMIGTILELLSRNH